MRFLGPLCAFLLAQAGLAADPVVIRADLPRVAPEWALLERELIETMDRAGEEFVRVYANPDGTLRWKERYEGGMNSSDDAYEGFRGFSLHTALGGSMKLDRLHRRVWEGITRQFTRYGQIYREFDSNWDWMHHGEGYVSFYPLGLVAPDDETFQDRSVRFAAMYTGEDPEVPNYDPERNIIRAVMNGSRGPKMEWTKRDWIPTNANLVYYHLPYADIPGVDSSTGWINDQASDDQLARIVKTMSDRMARGDVPINLTVTPLVANAFLYTGDRKYADWVTKYVGGWAERTRLNNGIMPDNVGLSGEVGEYTGGNWWGGYYGWRWVRGGWDVVLASLTAAKVAVLLTGDEKWLDLPRSQLRLMHDKGKAERNGWNVPIRYDNDQGWHYFVKEDAYAAVILWAASQDPRDWEIVEQLAEAQGGPGNDPDLGWAYFLDGELPDFPERSFRDDLAFIARQMKHILNERGDPETWYDAKWLEREPMPTDNLVRLTLGGMPVQKRGEMLHSRLRYFDADRRRPGLPADVAALVTKIAGNVVEVELVNTNLFESRSLIVQAGAYGEHDAREVEYLAATEYQAPGARAANRLASETRTAAVGGNHFQVDLDSGAGTKLRIVMDLYANTPSYRFPWQEARR